MQKCDIFVAFKNFKALVEKKSSCIIQFLRFDRGGQFTFKKFKTVKFFNKKQKLITFFSQRLQKIIEHSLESY